MKKTPKISVIVTTYNRKKYLTKTINSILNQTYQNFELIVVDNFSDYNFLDFIKSFKSNKIRPFQNNNRGIIAINRNYGIRRAFGEFFAFCDDDDIWLENKLELQIEYIIKNNYDLVYTNIYTYTNIMNLDKSNYADIKNIDQLLFKNYITLSSVIVRKRKLISFNESRKLISLEDYDLWIKLILNDFKFGFLKNHLVKYRILNDSVGNRNRLKTFKIQLLYNINLLFSYNFSYKSLLIIFYNIIFLIFKIGIYLVYKKK